MGHDFQSLKATTMSSPSIHAGISLLIAALSAKEQVPYKTLSKLIVVMKELTND
jgi:hypothetical protein